MARILVIEDCEPVRRVTRRILETQGHEVLEASDGAQGLALFGQRGADVVLCDLRLPRLRGEVAMRELRRLSGRVGIIATTGDLTLLPEDGTTILGADLILAKPFRAERLLEVVDRALDLVRQWDSAAGT
jgi:CheY-like chemotaxis protein